MSINEQMFQNPTASVPQETFGRSPAQVAIPLGNVQNIVYLIDTNNSTPSVSPQRELLESC